MFEISVVIGLVFLAFVLVGFVAWFAYRGGYVAGFEDAISEHNLAVRARWHAAEQRPAQRDPYDRDDAYAITVEETSGRIHKFPYRGEVD